MDLDKSEEAVRQVLKWKAIAIAVAVAASIVIGLPHILSSGQSTDEHEPIILNNDTHGVNKIASVEINPGGVSPVEKIKIHE